MYAADHSHPRSQVDDSGRGRWIGLIAAAGVLAMAAGCSGGDDAATQLAVSGREPSAAATTAVVEESTQHRDAASVSGEDRPVATTAVAVENAQPQFVAVEQIPGDPPEDVPSALDNINDPAFPKPLVDPAEIRSGGPPPDGIPPIDNPGFEIASGVDWLEDVEPVLLLELNGEARAYPIQIMTWHEIVNDTFGDVPVTVSYCPLCNSAIAYIRRADGRTLDFGTSGLLYNSSLVMYDRQTETLWSHFSSEAVIGELTGAKLETVPTQVVSWESFRKTHPDGLVLSRQTGFDRDYGANPYPGYDDVNDPPFLFDGPVDGRLPAKTRVVSIRGATESVAVPLDALSASGVLEVTVDGNPVVLVHAPGTASALEDDTVAGGRDIGTVGVFVAEVDGQRVDLQPSGGGTFTDANSGSLFDVLGIATDGPLAGSQLPPVEHLDTFWFAIAAFEPDTQIIAE